MQVDRDKPYIFTVPEVLSADECRDLIARIETAGPEAAPINTMTGTRVKPNVRNNERVMFDDPELAMQLVDRVEHKVPAEIQGMILCGANERIRCYRYQPGMRFAPHADGAFVRDVDEMSWYTFMVYLNDDFDGGNTTFIVEPEVSITPEAGKALLFQHPIMHEGSVVTSGVKYVLRTDLMYRTKHSSKD